MRAIVVWLLLASTAFAGHCSRKSYHSLKSSYNWSNSCYSCHPRPSSKTWKDGLIDIAKQQQDYAAMLEGLAQLGFTQQGAQYQSYASQGTTPYAYTQEFSSSYGAVDIASLYNQAGRLATQAQELAGQAGSDFSALALQEGANQAEVAKILAQGHAASQALAAAKGEPSQPAQIRTFTFNVSSSGEVELVPGAETHTKFEVVATGEFGKCIQCHTGDEPKGGFNLSNGIPDEMKDKVLTRILLPDSDEKHMPPGDSTQLSPQEKLKIMELLTKPLE